MLKNFFGKFKGKKTEEENEEKLDFVQVSETEEESSAEKTLFESVDEISKPAESMLKEAENNIEKEAFEAAEITEKTEKTEKELIEETTEEEENTEEKKEEAFSETPIDDEEEKQGFFKKLAMGLSKTKSAISDKVDTVLASFRTVDEELFEELEEALIMADIGVDTSLYIIDELREKSKKEKITDAAEIKKALKEIITEILKGTDSELHLNSKPSVIMVIGVNGVGKTTSIGKMAAGFVKQGKKVVLAAGDTFRAAAIDQLEIWAKRSGADIVKHSEGSDPSSVVFDAIQAAKARNADVVICDTAGRLHNKKHLMEELKKTSRVIERETGAPPSEFLLVLDGSTGQNALIQAKEFANVSPITGVILTKLDGTAKGGVVIALAREQKIGVKLIGVGEGVSDMQRFNPEQFAEAIF